MENTKERIRQWIIDFLREIDPECNTIEIVDSTDPIRNLGLKSIDGVACACSMSEKLGFQIPLGVNPFVDDEQRKSRCLSEIVDTVFLLTQTAKDKKHG
ncbi:hypothetical protein JW979_01735 [bacterium]|nr:hypothetical protein [candidate division CSSED10-310 bacterium]